MGSIPSDWRLHESQGDAQEDPAQPRPDLSLPGLQPWQEHTHSVCSLLCVHTEAVSKDRGQHTPGGRCGPDAPSPLSSRNWWWPAAQMDGGHASIPELSVNTSQTQARHGLAQGVPLQQQLGPASWAW